MHTDTAAPVKTTERVNYQKHIPAVLQAMGAVETALTTAEIDPHLKHLVKLRASQINKCTFCIRMHTQEARDDGETTERLDMLVAWDHSSLFSESEKAALAWTEVLTVFERQTDYGEQRARLRRFFSDPEISALTAYIAMINLWNRMQVSNH